MLPAFFIAHGSPMLALENNEYTRLLRSLGASMRPSAAVLFSAHWESAVQQVSAAEQHGTIYDFGGFPEALYQIKYPAPGAAAVTEEIGQRLRASGIPYQTNAQRGLDHGAWVVLRLLYPDASVPVVAMSVNPDLPPAAQYAIGRALSPLRAQDVLIIGSGGTVHNFATMRMGTTQTAPWAVEFDDWINTKASEWDLDSLFDYEQQAPHVRMAVPVGGNEHFVPLFYAMGAADDERTVRQVHRSYQYGSLSHAVWQLGTTDYTDLV